MAVAISTGMTKLTNDDLDRVQGGAGSPFKPVSVDGRKVWQISKKALLRENQGFPLDPRW